MRNFFSRRASAQAVSEYALIVMFIVIGIVALLAITGVDLQSVYCRVATGLGLVNVCGNYFSDEFANLNNWQIVNGNWRTENGELVGSGGEGRIFRELNQRDYLINIPAANLDRGNGYGVFFRATDVRNVDGYTFQYDPGYGSGAFIMRKWVNGNELSPFAVATAPASYNWNTNRSVQVAVKGNTFTAYVDGKQVLQGTDSTYSQGGIGFRTWDATTAHFGSVAVDPVK